MRKGLFFILGIGVASYCLGSQMFSAKRKFQLQTERSVSLPKSLVAPGEKVIVPEVSILGEKSFIDTLHYDGPNAGNAVGLGGGTPPYTWYAAVRYLPAVPGTLIAVIFWHHETATHAGSVRVWEAGTASSPGTEVRTEAYSASGQDWIRVDLSTPYIYADGVDMWFGLDVTHGEGEYPIGIDAGPAVDGRGDWVQWDVNPWDELQNLGLDYNWNIRGIAKTSEVSSDVGVASIEKPGDGVWVGTACLVKATVENLGSGSETFLAGVGILNEVGTPVYADTQTVADLGGGEARQITFNDWTPLLYDEKYTVIATTQLAGDMNPVNDTLQKVSQTYEEGEIAYDDFGWEWRCAVDSINGANDCLAVRFTPYVTEPFWVTKAKIFVTDTEPFEYIGLFPDNGAVAPDLGSPYQKFTNPVDTIAWRWMVLNFDTTTFQVTTPDDIWLVAKLTPGLVDNYCIGGDETFPIDSRSYSTADLSEWTAWTNIDFMMRIVHLPISSVEEIPSYPEFKISHSMNPVKDRFSIEYAVPTRMNVSINLYDITGSLVRTLENGPLNAGNYKKEVSTTELSTGIYFLRAEAGKSIKTQKLILLK